MPFSISIAHFHWCSTNHRQQM